MCSSKINKRNIQTKASYLLYSLEITVCYQVFNHCWIMGLMLRVWVLGTWVNIDKFLGAAKETRDEMGVAQKPHDSDSIMFLSEPTMELFTSSDYISAQIYYIPKKSMCMQVQAPYCWRQITGSAAHGIFTSKFTLCNWPCKNNNFSHYLTEAIPNQSKYSKPGW